VQQRQKKYNPNTAKQQAHAKTDQAATKTKGKNKLPGQKQQHKPNQQQHNLNNRETKTLSIFGLGCESEVCIQYSHSR
jgi:hypothetical protein